jgi:hypothetical protein
MYGQLEASARVVARDGGQLASVADTFKRQKPGNDVTRS